MLNVEQNVQRKTCAPYEKAWPQCHCSQRKNHSYATARVISINRTPNLPKRYISFQYFVFVSLRLSGESPVFLKKKKKNPENRGP